MRGVNDAREHGSEAEKVARQGHDKRDDALPLFRRRVHKTAVATPLAVASDAVARPDAVPGPPALRRRATPPRALWVRVELVVLGVVPQVREDAREEEVLVLVRRLLIHLPVLATVVRLAKTTEPSKRHPITAFYFPTNLMRYCIVSETKPALFCAFPTPALISQRWRQMPKFKEQREVERRLQCLVQLPP